MTNTASPTTGSTTGKHWTVCAARPVTYEVRSVTDVFDPANAALLAGGRGAGSRRFLVVDEHVHEFHAARIAAYFSKLGIETRTFVFRAGEANKTLQMWQQLLCALDAFPIHRRDEPLIAIGGGVLTDTAGFAAASFRRGVPRVVVPTTLMGYVDAAVGVKTGINFNGHKNRLGSFEPPRAVLLDRALLATLPARHLRNGLCEILKLAIICDRALFELLERFGDDALASAFQGKGSAEILDRAVAGMLAELEPNLFEAELAREVDFGHTFSYGLEAQYPEQLLHGEAVLLDILASCEIACERGMFSETAFERVLALVARLRIKPRSELLDPALMWRALADRVEHRNGYQHVPLPAEIGRGVFAEGISYIEIVAATAALKGRLEEDEHAIQC